MAIEGVTIRLNRLATDKSSATPMMVTTTPTPFFHGITANLLVHNVRCCTTQTGVSSTSSRNLRDPLAGAKQSGIGLLALVELCIEQGLCYMPHDLSQPSKC